MIVKLQAECDISKQFFFSSVYFFEMEKEKMKTKPNNFSKK